MKDNVITVILPVHNSAKTLEESLKSILKQTHKELEVIAIDDFSRDKSYQILQKFKKKDKRIKLYKNVKRYGIAVTLNRAIKKSKGAYVAFMDADDSSDLDRLKKEMEFLNSNPEVVAVGTQCAFINDKDKKIGKSSFPIENDLIYQNPLHGISMQFETVLINKKNLPKDVLKFESNSSPFIYSDVLMKIAPYGKFSNLKQILHYHRNDPENYLTHIKRNIVSLFKLWIKSKAFYDYNASIRSFFAPIIKSV